MRETRLKTALGRVWAWLCPWLEHPRLASRLALLAVVLSSSALFLGFYADDFVGRFIYSTLPGAARLYRNYSGGFGLAIGDPAENHWQMEQGWAPWWHYDQLRFSLFRPLGEVVHGLDFRLFPQSATLMHLHNLLWLAAMVIAATWMYRAVLGLTVGGAAALLLATDQTHGFTVGFISNRHALMSALLASLCLGLHVRYRRGGAARDGWLAPLFYAIGLLTSESTVAVVAYIVGYELLAQPGPWRRRALAATPYLAITVVWRALYTKAGYGAGGSGVYIDIGREPLHFAREFLERGPVLWLGQFLFPPADIYNFVSERGAQAMLAWALLVAAGSLLALWPLLKREPTARFWLLGMLGSLVPAAAAVPHNRQLVFPSLGAMALLAQLFHSYATALPDGLRGLGRWGVRFGALLLAFRLIVSPLALPFTTASVALTSSMNRAAETIGDEYAGRDLVFVTAPSYFTVRMVQLMKRVDGAPLPERFRTISCEPDGLTIARPSPTTLEVTFEHGLLSQPLANELHRDRRIPMPVGTRVELSGFLVEVLHTTPDGRPDRVRFTFDKPLDDPSLAFVRFEQGRFVPFTPPVVGAVVEVPGAKRSLKL